MSVQNIKLFCIIDGESTSFSVKVAPDDTIDGLKEAIKEKERPDFDDLASRTLVLTHVAVLDEGKQVNLSAVKVATPLIMGSAKISEVFGVAPAMGTIHIIVQRPTRESSAVLSSIISTRIGWNLYMAADNQNILIPQKLIGLLNSSNYVPQPRQGFRGVLQNAQAGSLVTLPFMGQDPKHFALEYQGRQLLITQQMADVWQLLSQDQTSQLPFARSIKRILSGPKGIGKSYLALFLAAKAYSENWPTLYISDASCLIQDSKESSSEQILQRFLSINKDIMSAQDLNYLVENSTGDYQSASSYISAIWSIFNHTSKKALLVVDEHGTLFDVESVPDRLHILSPLKYLNFWSEHSGGSRIVLTGISHAKFEEKYLRRDMQDWIEFVGPLSQNAFDKLISIHPFLQVPAIAREANMIVNYVPRELMYLDEYIRNGGQYISANEVDQALERFRASRSASFQKKAENYYQSLEMDEKRSYRKALSNMFLRSSNITAIVSFDWEFLDTGLVYRYRDEHQYVRYKVLCPAAQDALLQVYSNFPLPKDISLVALMEGNLRGEQFEEIFFQQLVKYRDITFIATNLNAKSKSLVPIQFQHFICLYQDQLSPGPDHVRSLVRGYSRYPRFDFMIGSTFIQLSLSKFDVHNTGTAEIGLAFARPFNNDPQQRNQIEVYMDSVFGGTHRAEHNREGKFIVTRDNISVLDFKIVYIQGSIGKPSHKQLVKKYPDLLHVNYDELKSKMFGEFLR